MTALYTPPANAEVVLKKRYYAEGENWERMLKRCSFGNDEYYRLMAEGLFLPNSPTLMNAGLPGGNTLSACFVFDVQDSLLGDWPHGGLDQPDPNSIVGTKFKAAAVARAGGGVGYYLGNIRPEGSPIKCGTHRKACGPVAVLKDYHSLRQLITQGGRRDLAQMAILDAHHPDIRKFIHCKDDDPKSLESFNISVSWRDEFLDQIDFGWDRQFHAPESSNEWTRLWWEQCESAWKTGDPGMFFWSAANRFNATPHLGNINATNPCGETPNLSDEPCNLGSLVLGRFVRGVGKSAKVDWGLLGEAVRTAINYMDDILDNNIFPHPAINHMARHTRKLGLGPMGLADALALMHIPYDSQEAVDVSAQFAKTINGTALTQSIALGGKKGPYPAYKDAPEEVKAKFPFARNSTRTSVAPTGTIHILADAKSSGIEPFYALENTRTTFEGDVLKEKVEGDRYKGHVPKIAEEIHWSWHVKHQAAWQKHTNLGVSKTINLPNSATVQDVSDVYREMWKSGCKGGTVFRDGCRSEQVLVKTRSTIYSTSAPTTVPATNGKAKLPADRTGTTHKFRVGGVKGYLTVNTFPDGKPAEIFIRAAKGGSAVNGMLDTWAMTFSNALQHGTPLEDLVRLHRGSKFEPMGLTGHAVIKTATSIPDYIVRYLELRFVKPKKDDKPSGSATSDEPCPDCGCLLVMQSGCLICPETGCGYSKC